MSARWTKLQRRRQTPYGRVTARSPSPGAVAAEAAAAAADEEAEDDDDPATWDDEDAWAEPAVAWGFRSGRGHGRDRDPLAIPGGVGERGQAQAPRTAASSSSQPSARASAAGDVGQLAGGASGSTAAGAAAMAEGRAEDGEDATAEKPKRLVTLLPSVFERRPPVLFFAYTVACGAAQRNTERAVPLGEEVPRLFYCHTDKVHEYNAVINILRQGGLYRVRYESQRWSLLWSKHPTPETMRALRTIQRTNHFPGSWHLGRKDLIWRNISRMQKRYGRAFNITPPGFILPKNMGSWEAARHRSPGSLWIWKPCSASCGRGIRVLSSSLSPEDSRELSRKRGVVQKYVDKPLLLDGYKFDMRIYVVVLSYDPLKVYINDEGLVRLATAKYSSSLDTLGSTNMHLTNYSVNKLNPAFIQPQDGRGPAKGETDEGSPKKADGDGEEPQAFKWSLTQLRQHLEKRGLSFDDMRDGIKDLVIKTLLAVEGPMQAEWVTATERRGESDDPDGWCATGPSGANRGTCFEIYGFDVIVDSAMKPWLLEVNICPSLSSGSPLDKRIKTKLVADALTLVGIKPPTSVWQHSGGTKRKAPDGITAEVAAECGAVSPVAYSMTNVAMEDRWQQLRTAATAEDAVRKFDQVEWEMILEHHDEDMRSGGLERIYPTDQSAHYVPFMGEESYCNLVLRRWHEAGGAKMFERGAPQHALLPKSVPRKTCFTRT